MDTPNFRHLQVTDTGDVCVVELLSEKLASQSDVDAVVGELFQLVESHPARNVLLDFSAVKMVTSLMLGRLLRLNEKVTNGGGKLALCNLDGTVHRVFALTKLTKVFDIRATQAEALAGF